jgi:hypothetical protein
MYLLKHWLADCERRRESVLHTQGLGGEISLFFHHHSIIAYSEEKGSTRDAEANLEVGDAPAGEKWT